MTARSLAFALSKTFELGYTLVLGVWVYFLALVRLAKRIGDMYGTFEVRRIVFVAHVGIIGVVKRTGPGGGYRQSRGHVRGFHSSIRSYGCV